MDNRRLQRPGYLGRAILTGMDFKRATDPQLACHVARIDADMPTNIAGTLDSIVYRIRAELPTLECRGKPMFEAARTRCVGTPRSTFAKSQNLPASVVVLSVRPARILS